MNGIETSEGMMTLVSVNISEDLNCSSNNEVERRKDVKVQQAGLWRLLIE